MGRKQSLPVVADRREPTEGSSRKLLSPNPIAIGLEIPKFAGIT